MMVCAIDKRTRTAYTEQQQVAEFHTTTAIALSIAVGFRLVFLGWFEFAVGRIAYALEIMTEIMTEMNKTKWI